MGSQWGIMSGSCTQVTHIGGWCASDLVKPECYTLPVNLPTRSWKEMVNYYVCVSGVKDWPHWIKGWKWKMMRLQWSTLDSTTSNTDQISALTVRWSHNLVYSDWICPWSGLRYVVLCLFVAPSTSKPPHFFCRHMNGARSPEAVALLSRGVAVGSPPN